MSRSGVSVADESLTAFNELKLGKKYKYIIYTLNEDKTEIIVKETSLDGDYDNFLEKLPENDCLYAVYDFEYEISATEGKRSKMIFIAWSPDTAPIRRALNGISTDIQGTDLSEVSYESILETVN